jgi:Eukaryotic protein of unknown function (DUF953)
MASITIDEAFGSSKLVRVDADTTDLFSKIDALKSTASDSYIIFHSTWCPDCRAVPAIVRGLRQHAERTGEEPSVILCDIGDRDTWKSGHHPFKQTGSTEDGRPALALKGIPSLIKWRGGSETGRLVKGLADGSAFAESEDAVSKLIIDYLDDNVNAGKRACVTDC